MFRVVSLISLTFFSCCSASELLWPTDKRTDQFKRLDLDQLRQITELLKIATYEYNTALGKPNWKVGVVGVITARLAKIQAFPMPKLRSEAMNIGVEAEELALGVEFERTLSASKSPTESAIRAHNRHTQRS